MQLALAEADSAEQRGEVPIGAVFVWQGEVIASAGNQSIADHDPCGHAEIVCLRQAAKRLGNYRLTGGTLVVTLEPCVMCAGAIVQARLETLIFGAYDYRAGACGSVYDLLREGRLNHRVREIRGGVLEVESRERLQRFFRRRRQRTAL